MQPEQDNQAQPGAVFTPANTPATPPPQLEPDPPERDDPRPDAMPEPQPELVVPQEPNILAADDTVVLSWQASEYLHHDKHVGWYLLFGLVFIALIAVAAVTKQWLTIGVFVVMAIALMVYANKQPRVLNYALGNLGITIGDKFYAYDTFRSFGLIQDVAWHVIDLDPNKRFMPRLNVMFENDKRDQIIDILSQHLPRHDRQPDLIERAARAMRF